MGIWVYIILFSLSSIWLFNTFIKIIEKLMNKENVAQEKIMASIAIFIIVVTGVSILDGLLHLS